MRRCLKCDHVSRESPDPEACPQCGAIYAKVEAAAKTGAPLRAPVVEPRGGRASVSPAESGFSSIRPKAEPFIGQLRRESLYPSFRTVVRIAYWVIIAVAAIALVSALFSGSGVAIAGAFVGAAVMVVLASFMREGTLMLADLSDAAVRMAERQERG